MRGVSASHTQWPGPAKVAMTRTTRMATAPAQNTLAMGMVAVAPASEVAVKWPAVSVSEPGAKEQMEVVAEGMTMTAARARIRETGGAATAHHLEGAAGHLMDGNSWDIGQQRWTSTLANRSNARHRSNIRAPPAPPRCMYPKCGNLCGQRGRKRFVASWGLRMSHICPCTPCPSPPRYRSKVESCHFAHLCWPGAAMSHPVEDAAGHLTNGTSGDIGQETLC